LIQELCFNPLISHIKSPLTWYTLMPCVCLYIYIYIYIYMRNASNTHYNTHIPIHSFWLVKTYMGSTKSCESHISLVSPMWILINQRECVEKCVLECVLLVFLIYIIWFVNLDQPKIIGHIFIWKKKYSFKGYFLFCFQIPKFSVTPFVTQ